MVPESREKIFNEKLAQFSDEEKKILGHIVAHGRVDRKSLLRLNLGSIDAVIHKAVDLGLLVADFATHMYSPAPQWAVLLEEWLTKIQVVVPPTPPPAPAATPRSPKKPN